MSHLQLLRSSVCVNAIAILALLLTVPAAAIEPPPTDPTWVEYVAALITAEEGRILGGLEQQYERAAFVERFWHSRDPDLSTPRNELREGWSERLGSAEAEFGGRTSDRGRTFLLNGPPKYMILELCPKLLLPLEIWFYPSVEPEADEDDSAIVFYSPGNGAEPVIWDPETHSLTDLMQRQARGTGDATRHLARECRRAREVSAILDRALPPAAAFAAPDGGNWLTAFRKEIVGVTQGRMDCELEFGFPGHLQNQTVVDGLLTVHRPPGSFDDPMDITVDGDIFRGDSSADSFRYRFEAKAAAGGSSDTATFSFRRHLAPGAYRLLLTVRSPSDQSIYHTEERLQVPSVNRVVHATEQASDSAVPALEQVALKIQPLPLGLVTGRQRIDVVTGGDGILDVVFILDGRRVMKKSRPPFSVELDLGQRPRTHTLEAVGHDQHGREVGRDLVPINVGPHRFAVRLVEPRQGIDYLDTVRVNAEINVPPGEKLDRVEIFFNEDRVATLYQPPFVQPNLPLTERRASGYVRAVAVLDDGNSAEDLVVVNAGSTVDQMQVDFVELYASALDRKGAPVTGLASTDFTVFEDGIEQMLRRFETVRDLPINASIVLDTSISMAEEIEEAEDAALQFFKNVIRPKDRAAVVVFSDQPELRVPLTNNHSRLAAGLVGIEADGETTLYDSVVFGLYYLAGLRGKRALILLTDGLDSRSRYSFEDTLDFARFSGVAVYPIGIGISPKEYEARRVLRQLASQTGGGCYFIDSTRGLERIYTQIEGELRSQYLLGYQSSQSGSDDFRRIEIRSGREDLEIKTIPGYYP